MAEFKEFDVWIFDINCRVYGDDRSSPIWIKHWRKTRVISETSRSWVTKTGIKIPKKNPPEWKYCFSEEGLTRRAWAKENRYKISRLVESIGYEELKAVAEILNYKD